MQAPRSVMRRHWMRQRALWKSRSDQRKTLEDRAACIRDAFASDDVRHERVAEADVTQELGAQAVGDNVHHLGTIGGGTDVHSKRPFAERHISHPNNGPATSSGSASVEAMAARFCRAVSPRVGVGGKRRIQRPHCRSGSNPETGIVGQQFSSLLRR